MTSAVCGGGGGGGGSHGPVSPPSTLQSPVSGGASPGQRCRGNIQPVEEKIIWESYIASLGLEVAGVGSSLQLLFFISTM